VNWESHKRSSRCAIYTRVSTENGLEQEFNSLDNQREASEAYIRSQAHEGWKLIRDRYDDGGFSGGSIDRPALAKLLDDVRARRVDVIVVYKVDRLTRSLADFAKLVELFDEHDASFISVTQAFNTTTSMGRLTLNMLLSFAPFEREITGERIRDKVAASKKRGTWDRVQRQLVAQTQTRADPRRNAESFLAGKLYDDRGNRMGPSHAGKDGRRWRYYVSRALLKGRETDAGSITRVPAAQIEKQVLDAIKSLIATRRWSEGRVAPSHVTLSGNMVGLHPKVIKPCPGLDYEDVLDAIERVTIGAKEIKIELSNAGVVDGQDRTLTVPWISPFPYQRREIIQGEDEPHAPIRPMRVRARAVFAESLRNAHRWLDELIKDSHQTIEVIAAREHKSERSIRMTLSLAFVAPPIVAAAIEGRLPRGFGSKRLMDLPMAWSHQWTALGLQVPT
jgi:DNA invertase Pin-like site-specific DNA recombinase